MRNATRCLATKAFQSGVVLALLLSTFLSTHESVAQANFTSIASGNWNAVGTWSQSGPADADGLPDANDNVTIANTHTVNVNVASACLALILNGSGVVNYTGNFTLAVGGNLTMNGTSQIIASADNAGRILTVAGSFNVPGTATNARIGNATANPTVTISGSTTIDGTFSLLNNARVKTFIGTVSVSGSWTSTAVTTTANLVFRNGVSSTGTNFAAGAATFNTTAGQSVGGSGNMSFSSAVSVAVDISLTGSGTISFANSVTLTGATTDVTNNKTGTVTFSNTGAAMLTGTAGASWIQGANSTLSYAGSTITTITLNGNSNTPNTVIYTGATPTIFPASYNHLTYSGTTTGTVATATTVNISGDLTASSGTFTAAGTGTVVFNGSAIQTISGAGAFTFVNLTMNTGGSNVQVNKSIAVNGTLNFAANGLLVVDQNSNITLGQTSTITNASSTRYIQLDGATGSSSQLIKTSAGTTASLQMNYPIGTSSGGYSPVTLPTVGGTAPTAGATLSIKTIYNASIQGQLRRTFRMIVAGNAAATTFSGPQFGYNTSVDVSGGDALANYNTIWHLSTGSGSWTTVAGTAPGAGTFTVTTPSHQLVTGTYYYTIGTSTAYPNTWYSYQSGNWSNWVNWTLDPSGTTLVNGLQLPPQPGDAIVILNGAIITNDASGQVVSSTTINGGGTLDMSTTTPNTLGTVTGTGLLRINGVSLPTGTYTSFVATTGGTIEYYNTGGTLPTAQTTYNKLILSNNTGSAISYNTANNLTVNSDFNITQTGGGGTVTWMINNGTANRRTIVLNGNLTVSANGRIRASASGVTGPHLLTLYGNLTNSGSIKFFDDTDADLDADTDFTGGSVYTRATKVNAVNVTFSGTDDQTVTSNNTTDFYRFIVDKGTGRQAKLTVNSSNANYFRLWGPANLYSNTATGISNCALSIVNGTLELTGTINIPILIVDGAVGAPTDVFAIPQDGALWLNSPNVTVTLTDNDTGNDDQRLTVDGLFRVSNGSTFNSGFSRGIGSTNGGTILIEGDAPLTHVNIWQYRPVFGGSGIFSYIQTGGEVNVGTTGYNGTPALAGVVDFVTDQYARFSLPTATSSFTMSGGTLNIGTPSANTSTAGSGDEGIDILCSTDNISVTGGTINAYIPSGGTYDFGINTNAPLYNLNIYREGTTATRVAVLKQATTISNDLAIITGNTPTLNCNGQNLSVGGNFNIQSNTVLLTGTNTITLNGSGAQLWTNDGTINQNTAAANPALMNNLVVNKSAGTLTLGGTGNFPGSSAITTGTIAGLTLTSGTLADGGKTLTVTTTLSNSATHSGAGVIVANGPTAIGGSNGTFGNLTLQTNGTITTSGNQTVNGTLRLIGANTTLSIGTYNLAALGNIYSDATTGVAFTANKRILTAGSRNDGGLTRQSVNATDILFPVGTGTLYTPATTNVAATTHGKITVTPVTGQHPNVNPTGQSVQYYWVVTSTGFSGASAVTHKTYTFSNSGLLQGTLTSYEPARYDPSTFTWSTGTTYNATGSTVIPNFSFGTNISGEYTAGNLTAGAILAYYSKVNNGNWNTAATWSNDAARVSTSASAPCATCPVVIGDGSSFNHTINIDGNGRSCGSLQIASGSTLNCSTYTGLNFGVNTGEVITGTGTLRINVSSGQFPAGDFKDFIGPNGGTVEWYGTNTTTYTIPATGSAPQNLNLNTYYNLVVNPNASQTINLPATSLTIYDTFKKKGAGTANTSTGVRTLTITDSLAINQGTFTIVSGAGNTSSFAMTGNTVIAAGAVFQAQNATSTHTFTTSSNITNNGTLDFRNTNGLVNLTFTGATNNSFSGPTATTTRLNTVTLNKGTSDANSLTVDVLGTSMNTLTNGWLTLTNGTINFNNSYSYTLVSTANTNFTIPGTARLKVQSGTVNIMADIDDDDNDLRLTGVLEVAGGTVNVNPNTARDRNNDIEYAAAGSPQVIVSSGSLYVNGAIRRSTTTLSGALDYNQSGGTVTVGGRNCDANNTRAVFEIENNPGSNFTLTGGTLTIQRSNNGSAYADLYINPASNSVSASGTIQMGLTSTPQYLTMTMNIAPAIGNFSILSAGAGAANAQVVDMQSSELTTLGTLTINTNSTLETNALDVNIGGDLSITGVYNGTISGGNTTTFNGSGAQTGTLTAGSTFQNITIDKSAGTATLNGSSSINNLNILNGTLSVTNTLDINGDIINNSVQTGAGTLNIAGSASTHSITSSNGSFGNLSLGGTATTKTVNVSGNMTITGTLNFTASGTYRYLNIGSNKLTFSQSAANVSNAGANRFIKTNGVSSDLGVVKDWAAGLGTFIYTVGTRTNYTPASFTLTVTSPGTYTVIPVDDQHPTADALGEQILNYYWIVTRGTGLAYNATGSHAYQFPTGFIGGSGGTLIAAHLDAIKLVGWTPSPGNGGGFTTVAPNTIMTFTNSLNTNLPGTGGVNPEVEFHYTAGTNATLPSPVTPVYSRLDLPLTVGNSSVGGDWSLATNWTTSSSGIGGTVQSSTPSGRPVVILSGARINMDMAGQRAFSTGINGLLVMVNTTGHNLGSVSGTGTLRAITSTLPAGNYTSFVSSAGGTIEYSPTTDINMNNRTTYNNLSIVGSNIVTMTNVDLTLNGNLSVGSGATLNNTTNNRNISIAGNLSNSGTVSQGTGTFTVAGNMANAGTYNQSSATINLGGNWSNTGTHNVGTGAVNFSGSGTQTITGTNSFYNFGVSKASGVVSLGVLTTITNQLTLTNGNINTTAAFPLVLTSTASSTAGNANSYVSGPMLATFNGSFTFPVGSTSASRYRPATVSATSGSDTWTVEYVGNNPSNQNYFNTVFNYNPPANLGKVSQFEYWNVSRTGATTAALELTYNTGSYVANPTNIGNVANLKVVRWDGTKWDLPPGGGTFSQTGTDVTGTVKVSVVSDFSPFTFGSTDPDSPLPITLLAFNAVLNNDQVDLAWRTAQEINNDKFVVEKATNLENFMEVGSVDGHGNTKEPHSYSLVDKYPAFGRSYYRLKQVDFDGKVTYSELKVIDYDGPRVATLRAYPNPFSVAKHGTLTIELSGLKEEKLIPIKVFNLHGQLVFEKIFDVSVPGQLIENISMGNGIARGLYIVKAGSAQQLIQKIMIE